MRKTISNTGKSSAATRLLYVVLLALLLLASGPGTCLADGKRIFFEHKDSVVTVFAYDREGRQTGQASGFVVSKDGAIATSYRIVSAASSLRIKREDTIREVKGLLLADMDNDIAIVKIDDKDLPAVKLQDAVSGRGGQKVYLIGSPRGDNKFFIEGSLVRTRDIAAGRKLLLITPTVTKGLSGAPVFNEQGEVIGIAAFFLEEAQPFNFAMPVAGLQEKLSEGKFVPLHNLTAYDKTAGYWFNLGAVYDSLVLYSSAAGAYQESLRIRPEDAVTHNALGLAYTNLGIYSFAIREYQEVIRLDPALKETYFNLGVAYAKSGNSPKALEAFEKAVALKPDDADAYNNLAFACYKTGRYPESIAAAQKAIGLRPGYAGAYYNLGVSYFRMKMNEEAVVALKQSIRLNPNIPEAHFALGVIYSIRDVQAATREYEVLKNLDPAGAEALQNIIKEAKTGDSYSPGPTASAEKNTTPPDPSVPAQDKAAPALSEAEVRPTQPGEAWHDEIPIDGPVLPKKDVRADNSITTGIRKTAPAGSLPSENTTPVIESTSSATDAAGSIPKQDLSLKGPQTVSRVLYSVQISVLKNRGGAQTLTDRLKKKHYDAFIETENKAVQNVRYRVLVGRFAEKSGAEKMAGILLKKEKMKSIIFRH